MLVEHLLKNAEEMGGEPAVIDDQGRYTFAQLGGAAAAAAAMIAKATSRPHVGLMLPAGFGFVANFYGALLAGKTVVPINFLLGAADVMHVICDSGIDTIVSAGPLAARLAGSPINVIDIAGLAPAPPPAMPSPPAKSADDVAVLMYTSGTSGPPKGVPLTFGNLQSDVDAAIETAQLRTRHRFLGVIPLFHAFGMTAMMLAPVQLGSCVICIARFSAAATLAAIREHGVSIMFGVPSMFAALHHMKSAAPADFANTYALISGGEPLSPVLREQFNERLGVPLLEGYGLTETSPVVALNSPQVHRPGSVGRAVPGAQIKIVDDNDRAVPNGEAGHILLRGPMVFRGYRNLPDATAAAFTVDGFFRTGDLGKFDADGFLFITGRHKDLIIVAGEKVSAREIEDVLAQHASVAEAAVLGKPDPSRGQVVVAFVTSRPGMTAKAQDLRAFCRDQGMPQWKVPREVFVLDELPRSPTGKVLKRVLAERLSND